MATAVNIAEWLGLVTFEFGALRYSICSIGAILGPYRHIQNVINEGA